MTRREAEIWKFIKSRESTTPKDVLEEFGYQYRTTVRNILRKMEKEGNIERNPLKAIDKHVVVMVPYLTPDEKLIANFSRLHREKHACPPFASEVAVELGFGITKTEALMKRMRNFGWVDGSDYVERHIVPAFILPVYEWFRENGYKTEHKKIASRHQIVAENDYYQVVVSATEVGRFSCNVVIRTDYSESKIRTVEKEFNRKEFASFGVSLQGFLPPVCEFRRWARRMSTESVRVDYDAKAGYSVTFVGLSREEAEAVVKTSKEK